MNRITSLSTVYTDTFRVEANRITTRGGKRVAAVGFQHYVPGMGTDGELVMDYRSALHYLRLNPASRVQYIYWAHDNPTIQGFGKSGRTFGEAKESPHTGLFSICTLSGETVLEETNVVLKELG